MKIARIKAAGLVAGALSVALALSACGGDDPAERARHHHERRAAATSTSP